MRHPFLVLGLLLLSATATPAQVSIGLNTPGVSLGIQLSAYPTLVRVPNYPVYYAPDLPANFFYYEDQYWVYEDDAWYVSSWYNGPWALVEPERVPLFVLRVPVRYYRAAPRYFRGWRPEAPPRWGDHWGPQWQRQRPAWDRWDRRAVPAPAPLPTYQRQYPSDRYPHAEEQKALQERPGRTAPPQHPAPVTAPHRNERPEPLPPHVPAPAPPASPQPAPQARPQPAPPRHEPSTPAPQALPRSPQLQPPTTQPQPAPTPMRPPAANREPSRPREQPPEPSRPQAAPAKPAQADHERERARAEGERGGMDRNR